jgi:hypothetical protein
MKLLYCTQCHDVFSLRVEPQKCHCGLSDGYYLSNERDAHYYGPCVPLGFNNASFLTAARANREGRHTGIEFKAFVIPYPCNTVMEHP